MDGGIFGVEHTPVCNNAALRPIGAEQGVQVRLAETPNDLLKVWAIRATVFLTTHGTRFADKFDSNDFTSAHILVTVNGEPAGALRLRWFPEFARFERLAIREEFRSLKVFRALVNYAMKLCAAKGYKYVVGLTRPAGLKFWQRYGAMIVSDAPIIQHGEEVYALRYELHGGIHPSLTAGAQGVGDPAFEQALNEPEIELLAA